MGQEDRQAECKNGAFCSFRRVHRKTKFKIRQKFLDEQSEEDGGVMDGNGSQDDDLLSFESVGGDGDEGSCQALTPSIEVELSSDMSIVEFPDFI